MGHMILPITGVYLVPFVDTTVTYTVCVTASILDDSLNFRKKTVGTNSRCEDMTGGAKYRKCGGLGWLWSLKVIGNVTIR